jgi:hypothetical protein
MLSDWNNHHSGRRPDDLLCGESAPRLLPSTHTIRVRIPEQLSVMNCRAADKSSNAGLKSRQVMERSS